MPNVKVSQGVGWIEAGCEDCKEQAYLTKAVDDFSCVILRFKCGCPETTDLKIHSRDFGE